MTRSRQSRPGASAPVPPHGDPGLQPERTTLAWGRTVLALVTTAAVCLRWISHHGLFVLALFAVAVLTALVIYLSQRARYTRSSSGITSERVTAATASVAGLATASVSLGALGLYVVLVLA